jgi:hypothetical protein
VGIIAVLHTWDQTLKDHFHLHCLVPAGALSLDHSRWIHARPNFLFPVKASSRVFRGKFLDWLKHCEGGKIEPTDKEIKALWQKNWNVNAKKPFGSPHTVLDYLGRYTHRAALSNDRILQVENGQVNRAIGIGKMVIGKRPSFLMPTNSSAASCSTSCPMASCASVTSAFWPTALKNTCCLDAANFSIWIRLCPTAPVNQPKTCS